VITHAPVCGPSIFQAGRVPVQLATWCKGLTGTASMEGMSTGSKFHRTSDHADAGTVVQ